MTEHTEYKQREVNTPCLHRVKNIPERTVTVSGFTTGTTTQLSDEGNTRTWTWKIGYKPSKQAHRDNAVTQTALPHC